MASISTLLLIMSINHISYSLYTIDCRNNYCGDDSSETFDCASDDDCYIDCAHSTRYACRHSVFNCPANKRCTLNCESLSACHHTTINAESSSELLVECADTEETCRETEVYCPITNQPISNSYATTCSITGSSDNSYSVFRNMKIYAVNAFNDVYFDVSLTYDEDFVTLYCESGFSSSCLLSWTVANQCEDSSSSCNSIGFSTTNSPTTSNSTASNPTTPSPTTPSPTTPSPISSHSPASSTSNNFNIALYVIIGLIVLGLI